MRVTTFPNLGPVELMIVLAMACLFIWPAWRICAKAGFPGALGLLIIVPVGNLVLLLLLAFAEWPALRREKKHRPSDPLE